MEVIIKDAVQIPHCTFVCCVYDMQFYNLFSFNHQCWKLPIFLLTEVLKETAPSSISKPHFIISWIPGTKTKFKIFLIKIIICINENMLILTRIPTNKSCTPLVSV